MVLADPYSTTSTAVLLDGGQTGKCKTDTLQVDFLIYLFLNNPLLVLDQVLNPGHASSPIICGYNSGQHMFVPASDQCNKIQINIDTGTTTTTR